MREANSPCIDCGFSNAYHPGRRCKLCKQKRHNQLLKKRRANLTPEESEKRKSYEKQIQFRIKLKKFNLTESDYQTLLLNQDFKCAICRRNNPCGKGDWHLDHCHKTNTVRGLLCHYCNIALGCFSDSIDFLQSAITYLKKSNS